VCPSNLCILLGMATAREFATPRICHCPIPLV
jgi:hypothetical protein